MHDCTAVLSAINLLYNRTFVLTATWDVRMQMTKNDVFFFLVVESGSPREFARLNARGICSFSLCQ